MFIELQFVLCDLLDFLCTCMHTLSYTHPHSDINYKIVLVGDSGVGKTSLILKFVVSYVRENNNIVTVLLIVLWLQRLH